MAKTIDNDDFLQLCSYVEKEILGYDNNQKLQKKAVLRLRGLAKGQTIANNNCKQFGDYPYSVILLAFKANKVQISNAILNKEFNSEENKIAYICAIVRDKLNDIYIRYNNIKKSEDKMNIIDINVINHQGSEYQTKTNNKNNDKFADLW